MKFSVSFINGTFFMQIINNCVC
uniref:Uncharacterized protein n=1 Tax=Anguilla anguilla TaxID=7936 RepID=A0A0E9UX61_ANGAN